MPAQSIASGRRTRGPRRVPVAVKAIVLLSLALLPPLARSARAQDAPADDPPPDLDLGGYVQSLTALHDAGFDLPGVDRRTGFNSEVVRLKWSFHWGDDLVLQIHNRLQARVSTAESGLERSVVGLGVSVVPDRSLDLSTTLLEEDRLRVWHDIDRLAVTFYTDAADVTVGRQAITWGNATLFPIADLWSRFSPFELDTQEKPGIDAIRVLAYPAAGIEMDAVVADRGSLDDLSAGVRATFSLASADVYAGAGKFWNELIALGGVTFLRNQSRLRAEAALPWDLDSGQLDLPRVTLGIDWLGARLALTAEYHFNGVGAAEPAGYIAQLADPRFLRGESYFLGRHYLGGMASWRPDEAGRLQLSLTALANLGDPSAALTPLVSYDFGQSTSVLLGALQTFGSTPSLTATVPILQSEFGTYGDLWFTRVSVYF